MAVTPPAAASGLSRRARPLRRSAQTTCGQASAPLIYHDRNHDRTADHDPLVVLVEVERTNRLADQHDQERAEHGTKCTSLAAKQARATHDRRRDPIQFVPLPVS